MGGGGLDGPPLPLHEVESIECGGSSVYSHQPRTTGIVASSAQLSTKAVTFTPKQHRSEAECG
jgi:hypothetical protein